MSAGITDSPGVSIAGTVSLLPLPGTTTTPLLNFFGGIIMPGLRCANCCSAAKALRYSLARFLIAPASALNVCVSLACD